MTKGWNSWIAVAGLLVSACGQASEPASNAASTNAAGANVAANEAAPAAKVPEPSPPAEAAAPAYTLGANGLEPGLAFGTKQADALAAATAAFGAPGQLEHNDECGEGPMDLVSFGALQLAFQDGRLAGWSLNEGRPALRTKSGLTVGAPRSALGNLEIDEDSSLGPEFDAQGIGGILDENGAKVLALWAGLVCQFR